MSAELTTIKLNVEEHLLLDQPLLRLPIEISRSNFKSAQIEVDKAKKNVISTCNSAVASVHKTSSGAVSLNQNGVDAASKAAMTAIDSMIQKTNILKRKLSAISTSTEAANSSLGARIRHMNEVQTIPSLADVQYDEWSRKRLDRLLVDYLLRQGFNSSAKALAKTKGIEDLVQVEIEAFEACGKIERCLREQNSTKEALAWCDENKKELAKVDRELRFQLRLQQFVELLKRGQTLEALAHGQKHLATHKDWLWVHRAAAALVLSSNNSYAPLQALFSEDRWFWLADLFVHTHHQLYSIPAVPPLNTALSIGLSALKTPACHSKGSIATSSEREIRSQLAPMNGHTNGHGSDTPARESLIVSLPTTGNGYPFSNSNPAPAPRLSSWTTPICPICSTELNALAKDVPNAHHSKSHVDHDPVVLPNGRIYGADRLERANVKLGTEKGKVRDPLDGQEWDASKIRKVFIT